MTRPSGDFERPSLHIEVGLSAVVVAVTKEQPRILTVPARGRQTEAGFLGLSEEPEGKASDGPKRALPFGPLDPGDHRTLERGLRSWVLELTGQELGYCEQLYTFGDRDRALRGLDSGRLVSVSYLALGVETEALKSASWADGYSYLPWEDFRSGQPRVLTREILPALQRWSEVGEMEARRERRARVEIAFGLEMASWDPDRVLDRYELLYEAGLVYEAARDLEAGRRQEPVALEASRASESARWVGLPMPLDHRRILATALGRLRAKIRYRPVVFELLGETFTLLRLQRVVEALSGVELHKQNFRRLVDKGGLVEGTGAMDGSTGGRPAELFRFRREVLLERPTPGVGLPGFARSGQL